MGLFTTPSNIMLTKIEQEDKIACLEFGIKCLKSLLFKDGSEDQFEINKKPEGIRKKL